MAAGLEPPGTWTGRAAPDLGLSGPVAPADLGAVMAAVHPLTGEALGASRTKTRAFDIVCSAPKSVSVAWAVAAPDEAAEIEAARRAAVAATVRYLEDCAVQGYRRPLVPAVVAAAFPHRTSRSGDPHLHTHLVVANLGRGTGGDGSHPLRHNRGTRPGGGAWWALDSRVLLVHLGAAGHVFHAQLRHEISTRLGWGFGPSRGGVGQLEHVPEAVVRHFSGRRRQVEDVMARHGGSSRRAARLAALADRPDRDWDRPAEEMRPEWRARADALGFRPGDAGGAVSGPGGAGRPDGAPDLEVTGLGSLSSFSRRDVIRALAAHHREGVPVGRLTAMADALLRGPDVVAVPGPGPRRRGDVVRLRTGSLLVVPTDPARFVGRRELARQAELVGLARSARDRLELVRVGAGAVRSDLLAGRRPAWEAGGLRVIGAAPDDASARELEASTGIRTSAAGRLETALGAVRSGALVPTVVVVAGADQLPTSTLLRLVSPALASGGRAVLLADPVAPPPSDRAGGWRALEAELGSLRAGRMPAGPEHPYSGRPDPGSPDPGSPDPGSATAATVGPFVLSPDPAVLRALLVADWARACPPGSPPSAWPVMVATRKPDIADLNDRARRIRAGRGELTGPQTPVGGLPARVGDVVAVTAVDRAARAAGWQLGALWSVEAGGRYLAAPGGERRVAPDGGVELRYAYARTRHQGAFSGAPGLLVLGEPAAGIRPGPGARHYVVCDRGDRSRADRLLGTVAELDPPRFLTAVLGPPPAGPTGRQTWRETAGAVLAYRERWGVTDPERALGPPAVEPAARSHRSRLEQRLESAGRRLGVPLALPSPGLPGRDRAGERRAVPSGGEGRIR